MRLSSAFADRVTAFVLFILGAGFLYGGFVMDRLEIRRIHPASIPGLLPMILGMAMMVCAVALYLSARRDDPGEDPGDVSWANLGIVIAWCAVYALAAVGNMPFAPATAIFVAGFTIWFLRDADTGRWPSPKTIGAIVVFSAFIGWGVAALFRYGFLVRLP